MVATQQYPPERIEWAKEMRLIYSPADMTHEDGSINQEFFRPKQVVMMEEKKWGNEERELLYVGLEKYGVGKWREISEELLPKWDETALRIKAARLFGSQSLARYVGWKADKVAIEQERALNKEIGEETGCWKGGVLVEDDHGTVKKALEKRGISAEHKQ